MICGHTEDKLGSTGRHFDENRQSRPLLTLARRQTVGATAVAGRNVVLLNFGNPYVMADLPKASVALCTFSDAEASIDAAVDTLFGQLKPKGLLPIRISDAYPFGFGLRG
jgi:hypothetical protein